MTTDQRIAEWARGKAEWQRAYDKGRARRACEVKCGNNTSGPGLCPSCWQRIAEVMEQKK